MMRLRNTVQITLISTLLQGVYSQNLAAQEGSEALKLEEVMVTAQRTEQSLQDVPVAVTAFTREDMDREGFNTFQDIQHSVPNLSMTVVTPFASWVNMRGVPSNPNGVFNSGTTAGLATYVDGVVLVRPTGFNQDLANVQQIEVLRGPQGTLFGQNSNLGVINIITTKPSNELEGKFKLELGNYDTKRGTAYISGPIIKDVLAASASYFKAERDGYSKNYLYGDRTDDEDRESARVQMRFTPTEEFTADLNFDYLKGRSKSSNPDITSIAEFTGQTRLVPLALLLNPEWSEEDIIIPGARTVSQNSEYDYNNRDNDGVDLTMEYAFDNGYSLKSITAQKNYDSSFGDDFDGVGLDILYTLQQEDNDQFTQELQLISPRDQSVRFITGLFYLDLTSEATQDFPQGEDFPIPAPPLYMTSDVTTDSKAVFGHVDWDISNEISIFGGVRYSDVEKSVHMIQTESVIFGYPALDHKQSHEDDFVSWTTGINFDLEQRFDIPGLLYAKVSQGYKEGGFTVRSIDLDALGGDINNPDIGFDREDVISYEAGLKGSFFEQRLRSNLAIFYLDYTDIQTTVINEEDRQRIENGPEATSKGFELELDYLINEYFRGRASVGYTDATYGDFDECSAVVDCSGNTLPRSPDWTGNFSLIADYPMSNGWDLYSGVNYSYRSDSNLSSLNLPELDLGEVNLWNLQAGVRVPQYGLDLQLYLNNATDEEYYTSISDHTLGGIMGTSAVRYGPPKTYGARLTYQF